MPRKKRGDLRRKLKPDVIYNSELVARFINKTMLDGKKRSAEKLVYSAMNIAAEKLKLEPLVVFEKALENIYPSVEVRGKRIGGANYQVPMEVKSNRKVHLAMVWLIESTRSKSGKSFDKLLAQELVNAYNESGDAFKKKQDVHAAAEANKAFAHFAR